MGMFDEIRCEAPLPDGFDASDMWFQSKSFPFCGLCRYTITLGGRLLDAADNDLELDGYLIFYTSDPDGSSPSDESPLGRWREYRARFIDGPQAQQLAYRMQMPEHDRFVLERSLFRDLYNVDCPSAEALREAWDNLDLDEFNPINETLLPWQGIGEDAFYLNECMSAEDRLRFITLDEYARNDHDFQESSHQKEQPDYLPTPYRGQLFPRWARLFIHGKFRYATLNNLAGYLQTQISDQGQTLVEQLIPYEFIAGPNDGKRDGENYIWDKRRDANGLEPQLEELLSRLYKYEFRRTRELHEQFDEQAAGSVYIREVRYPGEDDNNVHFIFTDKTAMARTRFQTFLRDCREQQRPDIEITPLEERESTMLETYLREQHSDILDNFDPKTPKHRKKTTETGG